MICQISSVGSVEQEEFRSPMAESVEHQLSNGSRISINPRIKPRLPVVKPPKKVDKSSVVELMMRDLESTGASAEELEAERVESSKLSGGLMDIDDWIDQTLATKGYIQAQEDREDFNGYRGRCDQI